MTPEVLKHIFEPFFTTKEVDKGTGLGLAMVYGIVRQHQGLIEAQSLPDQGTLFRLYFPMLEEEPALSGTVSQQADAPASVADIALPDLEKGLVLIAEDEVVVREWTRSVMESAGFQVLAAGNGEEALTLFDSNADRIALALLDVVMPRRNGIDVARRIANVRPDLPVIFMTGNDFGMLEEHTAYSSDTSMPNRMVTIRKPFRGRELLQMVGEVMARPDRERE